MNIGMIGAGWWAEQHARALATLPDLQITAVCSGSLAAAQAFSGRFGGQAYASADALLRAPDLDAVLVAAPHALHQELALQVIASGKPLLLEKPVAVNASGTHLILSAAKAAQLPCLVGLTSHYFPGFAAARALLATGELGRPLAGQSVFQKVWMEPNRRDWHLDRVRGGGMLLTAGIHALDRLMWLMDAPVHGVSAVIGTYLHAQQADDLASLFLRFAGGGAGMVGSYGYAQGAPENSTQLICERGALRATPATLEIGRDNAWTPVQLPLTGELVAGDLVTYALAQEWLDLREWSKRGRPPQVTPEFAGEVMDVIFAAEQSSALGSEVQLNAPLR